MELIDLQIDFVNDKMKCNYKKEFDHLDNTVESPESLIEGVYIKFY